MCEPSLREKEALNRIIHKVPRIPVLIIIKTLSE
jgi:hypothetical protein